MSDLAVSVIGNLITMWLLFVLNKSGESASARNQHAPSASTNLAQAPPMTPGPMVRRPVAPLILSGLFAAGLFFVLDFIFPPFGLARLLDQTSLGLFRSNPAYELRGEAINTIERNKIDAQNDLRRVEDDIFSLMRRTGGLEKALRDSGQNATADRMVAVAESQARLLQEQTKASLEARTKAASEQNSRLMAESDTELVSQRGLSGRIGEGMETFTNWCARFLCLAVMASFVLRKWQMPSPSFKMGGALGLVAVFLGVMRIFIPLGVFDLVVPLFAGAVIFASNNEQMTSRQVVRAAMALFFERSGRALAIVAMVVMVAGFGALAGYYVPPMVISLIDPSLLVGGEIEPLSSVLLAVFGFEFGRSLSAVCFVSVLAGPIVRAPKLDVPGDLVKAI